MCEQLRIRCDQPQFIVMAFDEVMVEIKRMGILLVCLHEDRFFRAVKTACSMPFLAAVAISKSNRPQ